MASGLLIVALGAAVIFLAAMGQPIEELSRLAILGRDDQFFPAAFMRRLAQERLCTVPDETPGCHCVALSHPRELSDLLVSYLD